MNDGNKWRNFSGKYKRSLQVYGVQAVMYGVSYWIEFMIILMLLHLASGNQITTYEHNGLICNLCRPGTLLVKHCTETQDTQCAWCPEHTYTDFPHKASYCRQCRVYCQRLFEFPALNCTRTQNMVCRCKQGFYLHSEFDPYCKPLRFCDVGFGVKIQGTATSNVICEPCPDGHFSDVDSYTQQCQPHIDCSKHGMSLVASGNSTHDNVCSGHQSQGNIHDTRTVVSYITVKDNTTISMTDHEKSTRENFTNGESEVPHIQSVVGPVVIALIIGIPSCIFIVGCIMWRFRHKVRECRGLMSPVSSNRSSTVSSAATSTDTLNKNQVEMMPSIRREETAKMTGSVHECFIQQADNADGGGAPCSQDNKNSRHQLRKRISTGSVSDLINESDLAGATRPLLSRSNSRQSQNRDSDLLSLQEFSLEDFNEDTFKWFVAGNVSPKDSNWRLFLLNLPGLFKLRNTDIEYMYHDLFHQHGLKYVIVKCLEEWKKKNPENDLVEAVTLALYSTKDVKYKCLADKIAEQKKQSSIHH